jgi:amino acid transporter
VVGFPALTFTIVNFIVGSAIFVMPATVAGFLGPAGVAAYLVSGFAMMAVALCFAEAASRVTGAGGAYAYVRCAFGPWAGFLTGSLLWFANGVVSDAAVAAALAGTVGTILPSLAAGTSRAVLLGVIYLVFITVNVIGTRQGVRTVTLLTVLKLAPLFLLIVAGLVHLEPAQLVWHGPPPLGPLRQAALLLVFALMGVEGGVMLSAETKDAARTIPRAVILGVGLVIGLYLLLQTVAQSALGADLPRETAAPLAAAAGRLLGGPGRMVLLGGALVSMVGYLAGDLLAVPRSVVAMAENGFLPAVFGRIHPRFKTPYVAIIAYGALAYLVAVAGTFTQLAVLAAVSTLVIYAGVILSVLRLRKLGVTADRPPIRLPGGPLVPLVALAAVLWLVASAEPVELIATAGFLGVASLGYAISVWRKSRQLG